MDVAAEGGLAEEPDSLEFELRLVREAIRMVALGAARRVVLAGLRWGNDVLGEAGEALLEPGVRLAPLGRPHRAGIDIAVEAVSGSSIRPDPILASGVPEPAR